MIYEGVQEIEIKGKAGKDGLNGKTPVKGQDYFTDDEIKDVVTKATEIRSILDGLVNKVPPPKDGKKGKDGKDGYTPIKGIDYYTDEEKGKLVQDVLSKVPRVKDGKDGSPDTADQIVEKLESLDTHLSYAKLTGTPNLDEWAMRIRQASKTVSLKELDDVDLSELEQVEGKYVIGGIQSIVAGSNISINNTDPKNPVISATGSGGSGGTVDTIVGGTGIDVNSTDPANPIVEVDNTISTKSYATAMSIALS